MGLNLRPKINNDLDYFNKLIDAIDRSIAFNYEIVWKTKNDQVLELIINFSTFDIDISKRQNDNALIIELWDYHTGVSKRKERDYFALDINIETLIKHISKLINYGYAYGGVNEQKISSGTKLKLLEILTPTDILSIKKIVSSETTKLKSDIQNDIKNIEKDLNKHSQDKDSHLKEKNVKDIIKPEVEKTKQDLNAKIDTNIKNIEQSMDDKIDKVTNGKDFERKIKEMIADVMVKYHQTLWTKRGFWTAGLTK